MPVDVGVLRDADVGARPVELTLGVGPDDEFNFAMPAYDATGRKKRMMREVLDGTAGRLTSFRSLTFRGRWLSRRHLLDLLLLLIVHGATVGLLLIFLSVLMRCWPRA